MFHSSVFFLSVVSPASRGGVPELVLGQPLVPCGRGTALWTEMPCDCWLMEAMLYIVSFPCFFPWESFLFQIAEEKQIRAGKHLGD